MGITLEEMSWQGRVGEDHQFHGDEYTIAFRVDKSSPDTARISGMIAGATFTLKMRRELMEILKLKGFKLVVWERYRNGESVDVRVKL